MIVDLPDVTADSTSSATGFDEAVTEDENTTNQTNTTREAPSESRPQLLLWQTDDDEKLRPDEARDAPTGVSALESAFSIGGYTSFAFAGLTLLGVRWLQILK